MNKLIYIIILFFSWVAQPVYAEKDLYTPFILGKTLEFPKDHGAHFDFRFEWWYFTGHLKSANNKEFGYEITFFRLGFDPLQAKAKSAWKIDNLYVSHFAVTSPEGQFFFSEVVNRDNLNLAGAKENSLYVWNGSWFVKMTGNNLTISAESEKNKLTLHLTPIKPLLLQGDKGYSKKYKDVRDASYYYSFPLLNGNGELVLDGVKYDIISASSWMDHEFYTTIYSNKIGWDWFAIQLENNEQIMVYQLHHADEPPGKSKYSSGVIYKANGKIINLKADDFTITDLSSWKSPISNIKYPSSWKITIPKYNYDLTVTPVLQNQEIISLIGTYWEGKNSVSGIANHQPITGNAYVEIKPIKNK